MSDFKTLLSIRNLMTKHVHIIEKSTNVKTASAVMAEKQISSLLVEENGGKIVGILTESNIVRNLVAHDKSASGTQVADIMTTNLVELDPEETIFVARDKMKQSGVHHVIVVEAGKPVGIVSATDLLKT